MLYSVTVTFIFNVKHLLVMHLLKKNCTGSGCPPQICLDSHGPRRRVALVLLPDVRNTPVVVEVSNPEMQHYFNYSVIASQSLRFSIRSPHPIPLTHLYSPLHPHRLPTPISLPSHLPQKPPHSKTYSNATPVTSA